jgi:hypothetical protein
LFFILIIIPNHHSEVQLEELAVLPRLVWFEFVSWTGVHSVVQNLVELLVIVFEYLL